jgi:hypothetical protein
MQRTPVQSSNLLSVGYDRLNRVMEIEFNSGHVYQYFNVPEEIYIGLLNASSHGKYFHQHIRNAYQYRQVG